MIDAWDVYYDKLQAHEDAIGEAVLHPDALHIDRVTITRRELKRVVAHYGGDYFEEHTSAQPLPADGLTDCGD